MAVLGGVFGDTVRERVQLNEDSVWHGGPIGRNKNFGGTAGIAEMLLHSHAGELHPAACASQSVGDGSVRRGISS
ncbi:glycoside hydrolase family 95 protein [Paenibacillus sp. P25]|nr:glycoside hydrolase family 95 protein [Paenibacillus sp. P25]